MSEFTKGPWFANGVFVGTASTKDDIVSGVSYPAGGHEESEANANLIAAAPELYEALELVSDWWKRADGDMSINLEEKIRAALAKASPSLDKETE
jgi:hypothetical protein